MMPIPREQYEQGLDATDQKIVKFLQQTADLAYKGDELAKAVGVNLEAQDVFKSILNALDWRMRLNRLTEARHIEYRQVGNETYYAIRKAKQG